MEIVFGMLAAWGLIMLIWTLVGAVLLPLRRRGDLRLTVFLRGNGRPQLLGAVAAGTCLGQRVRADLVGYCDPVRWAGEEPRWVPNVRRTIAVFW